MDWMCQIDRGGLHETDGFNGSDGSMDDRMMETGWKSTLTKNTISNASKSGQIIRNSTTEKSLY